MDVPHLKNFLFIKKSRRGKCFHTKYGVQENDSFCASYVLHILSLTKVLGIDFIYAVLNLYYQTISQYKRHYEKQLLIKV